MGRLERQLPSGSGARLAETRRLWLVGAGPGYLIEPAVAGEPLIVRFRRRVLQMAGCHVRRLVNGQGLEPQLLGVGGRLQPGLALACTQQCE